MSSSRPGRRGCHHQQASSYLSAPLCCHQTVSCPDRAVVRGFQFFPMATFNMNEQRRASSDRYQSGWSRSSYSAEGRPPHWWCFTPLRNATAALPRPVELMSRLIARASGLSLWGGGDGRSRRSRPVVGVAKQRKLSIGPDFRDPLTNLVAGGGA